MATPSTDDFIEWVTAAAFLNQQGFAGLYEGRVMTPVGLFVVTPNRELLKKDPQGFRRIFKSTDFEAPRSLVLSQEKGFAFNFNLVPRYIQAVESAAIQVDFIPIKSFIPQ